MVIIMAYVVKGDLFRAPVALLVHAVNKEHENDDGDNNWPML